MNSGPTSERAYDEVKKRILAAEFRPGEQLDPAALAKQLESSQTPVRDALHILAGEGLLTTGSNEGFHVLHLDAPNLQDLYAWNAQVLLLSIHDWDTQTPATGPSDRSDQPRGVAAIEELFGSIARRSTNAEHDRTVRAINDRLHAARRSESIVFQVSNDDLAPLAQAFEASDRTTLQRLVGAYHRRRQRAAADILRAMYRVI